MIKLFYIIIFFEYKDNSQKLIYGHIYKKKNSKIKLFTYLKYEAKKNIFAIKIDRSFKILVFSY